MSSTDVFAISKDNFVLFGKQIQITLDDFKFGDAPTALQSVVECCRWRIVLQYLAVSCSVLQCLAVCCKQATSSPIWDSPLEFRAHYRAHNIPVDLAQHHQSAVESPPLPRSKCVAACCIVLQPGVVLLPSSHVCAPLPELSFLVRCSVLQCAAVCCIVFQFSGVCCNQLQ